jgi:hypothetical protein
MKNYRAIVNFINGSCVDYKNIEARNKVIAKKKIELDRQRKGDEMFIKSIKIEVLKNK